MLLVIPGWLWLWLGSETSPLRVVMFLAGYLALGVALTNRRRVEEPRRPANAQRACSDDRQDQFT